MRCGGAPPRRPPGARAGGGAGGRAGAGGRRRGGAGPRGGAPIRPHPDGWFDELSRFDPNRAPDHWLRRRCDRPHAADREATWWYGEGVWDAYRDLTPQQAFAES